MGKRVIITGAASGIGAASAEQMTRQGATVVGLDLNPSGDIIACDVRDQASVDRAVAEAIERLGGGVDVLINCAGIGIPQGAGERPNEGSLAVLDVNLIGPWRVTGAAIDALRESRGRVVNVASGLAFLTVPFATAYTMSKRGIVGYSDTLRMEHGDAITVTTVYPGYIKTPIHDAAAEQGGTLEGMVPDEPLSSAAEAMARAALGPPVRDLATTRRGTLNYAFLRAMPRRLVEWGTVRHLTRLARKGKLAGAPFERRFRA